MGGEAFNTHFRNLVAGVGEKIPLSNGTYVTGVNFDNAATTPAFFSVVNEVNKFLPWYSSVHRGKGYKSMLSTELYESGRDIIKRFVNADKERDTVIYTKNATESINILAHVLSRQKDRRNVVLSTWMEHVANDLPWRNKFNIDYIEVDGYGRLCLNDLEKKLRKYSGRVRLVAVTGASNVTGYINPVHEIAKNAHNYGAEILVDGAQWVPHMCVDMKPFGDCEHIDYLVFSGHKMYAPFGAGVLIGAKDTFKYGGVYCQGGSAVRLVTHKHVQWEEPPHKDEAGSPNVVGVVAMVAAIKTLSCIGMHNVFKREKDLLDYAIKRMEDVPSIKVYSNYKEGEIISIIPFNMDGVHHQLMSAILSFEAGIAVRNGFFCAHPYCERLLGYSAKDMEYYFKNTDALLPGMVRASFGLYNNYSEIDRLIYALNMIAMNKSYYVDKYSNNRSAFGIQNDV